MDAAFDEPNLYEQPSAPLDHSAHFEAPAHVASGMEEETEQPEAVPTVDDSFPDILGPEDDDMGECQDATMMSILEYLGVEKDTAANFVSSVAEPLSTFMQI